MSALFQKVVCLSLPVEDLDAALAFYRDQLGHELIWRTVEAAGLKLPRGEAELVLHTDKRPFEADLMVDSVPIAVERFVQAGGQLVQGPFEIRIGRCAVLEDPWGNKVVILDISKGLLKTDADGNVIE